LTYIHADFQNSPILRAAKDITQSALSNTHLYIDLNHKINEALVVHGMMIKLAKVDGLGYPWVNPMMVIVVTVTRRSKWMI